MDSTIPPIRPGVVSVPTTPRPTPTPVRVQFSEVLGGGARALVRGAQAALQALPGSPLMAVAVRGGGSGVPTTSAMDTTVPFSMHPGSAGVTVAPEGPGGTGVGGVGVGGGGAGTTGGQDGSLEGTIAQQQEMSLYYLQIQEEVNAQNRTFSALSNVLEVEHNTAKTAIGNIH
jgi:hypothetical protein